MIGRLLLGLLKGLVVGGLFGFGIANIPGLQAPGAVAHYLLAAAAGVLVGLVAGKPIWAKDAKIEAGMKAAVGALLGAGLMFAVRSWLKVPLPDIAALAKYAVPNTSLNEATGGHGTIGGLALTSFAVVTAVLGAFYDADNTPSAEDKSAKPAGTSATKESDKTRLAAAKQAAIDLDEFEDEAPADKKAKK